ncbi:DUF4253 domain-containing protein [Caulobacter sp. SLTY]|uniref:DUF4253 domain-containing protein n=1 Tax=Caulobacter sp. SLTY TaxID=2683262 RepID=UPI001412338C|nr:DUF4253 domain-containing protein [Caulobacter sp. SLTY]
MVTRRSIAGMVGAVLAVIGLRPAFAVAGQSAAEDEMLDLGAFPYPLVAVYGAVVMETVERLRREGRGWPVVIGDDFSAGRVAGALSDAGAPPAEILKAAATFRYPEDVKADRAAERAELLAMLRADPSIDPAILDEFEAGPAVGEWPPTFDGVEALSGYPTMSPGDRIHIALLPTSDPTEVPAYLRFGGYNSCPPPQAHVATLRSLRDRYGAEIVACTFDTIELRVPRRPATREEALALARELHAYCNDTIDQGLETLSNYAAALMVSESWLFWWD